MPPFVRRGRYGLGMAQTITVYDAPLLEWWDSAHALDAFPRAVIQADDGDDLLDVLNGALESITSRGGSDPPWGRPLQAGCPVWLDFARSSDDPAAPRTWVTQQYFFGVDLDGKLIVRDWHSLAMTVGDLRRAGESGYLPGDWDQIVILVPEGLGGGGELVSAFVDFLQTVGFETAVGAAGATATAAGQRAARRLLYDRRARQVAESWHDQGIEGPWTLTKWVDTKTAWDAAEVAKRLQLGGEEAVSLLEAMGYERSERLGKWTVGTSRKAVRQRQRWEKQAQKEWQRPRLS